ncbi:MAG: type II toxin-antitoxin system PemK/MazF family toxin [Candidatus Marinimicrobia bacterium]|nr:type II toxin-antitoxin system PemK/MazF family toxin [Candidatus Neomarinimicrobiota bacterium]
MEKGGLTKDSYIDCGQIRTIDKQRIIGKPGCFTPEIMKKIDRALKISLNLK